MLTPTARAGRGRSGSRDRIRGDMRLAGQYHRQFRWGIGVHRHREARVVVLVPGHLAQAGGPPAAGLRPPDVPPRKFLGHAVRRGDHHRNDPAVRPETIRRWANKTSSAMGMEMITTAASIRL